MSGAPGRLAGTTVGVTAARKGRQLADALERRGASTLLGPLIRADKREDDDVLMAQTDALLDAGPDWFAASTRKGMELWQQAAERNDRTADVEAMLDGARLVARSDKAVAGLAMWGFEPEYVADSETDAEVARWLVGQDAAGDTVGVQRHGHATGAFEELAAVSEMVMVTPYRSDPPEDTGPAEELITATADGRVDALTFTSRLAAANLFTVAQDMGGGVAGRLSDRLGGDVAVVAIGPVTGRVFDQRGIPVAVMPDRHKTGAMIEALCEWADDRAADRGAA